MIVLETERLFLRHLHLGDIDAMHQIYCDPEVMEFSLSGAVSREKSAEMTREAIAKYAEWGFGRWVVARKSDSEMIGFCGLGFFEDLDGADEIEIGYRFRKIAWGQGFASEAARAVKRHAFEVLSLGRVISIIEPANVRSVRVAEKNGMTIEKEITFCDKYVRIYAVSKDSEGA